MKIRIAFFDSGIGGLSVLHRALEILPQEQFIFFADEDHVPYGTKSREEVLTFTDSAFKFLMTRNVKAIVVACNTATSVAVREMRARYPIPIIGMEPAVKKALELFSRQKILVIATPITVNGEKLRRLIDRYDSENRVESLALPRLVDFAERQEFDSPAVRRYLQEEFQRFDFENFGAIVLGCTHFNYFKDSLREILPSRMKFVDGNDGTIRELIHRLGKNISGTNISAELQSTSRVEYYYSCRRVVEKLELNRIEKFLSRLDLMEKIE